MRCSIVFLLLVVFSTSCYGFAFGRWRRQASNATVNGAGSMNATNSSNADREIVTGDEIVLRNATIVIMQSPVIVVQGHGWNGTNSTQSSNSSDHGYATNPSGSQNQTDSDYTYRSSRYSNGYQEGNSTMGSKGNGTEQGDSDEHPMNATTSSGVENQTDSDDDNYRSSGLSNGFQEGNSTWGSQSEDHNGTTYGNSDDEENGHKSTTYGHDNDSEDHVSASSTMEPHSEEDNTSTYGSQDGEEVQETGHESSTSWDNMSHHSTEDGQNEEGEDHQQSTTDSNYESSSGW